MQCDGRWVLPGLAEALICIESIWTLRSCCRLQAQMQLYSEVQWTAPAELSISEVRHRHYVGYTIMEDRLQGAPKSEEPWYFKVGPDFTPYEPAQLLRCILCTMLCRLVAMPAY